MQKTTRAGKTLAAEGNTASRDRQTSFPNNEATLEEENKTAAGGTVPKNKFPKRGSGNQAWSVKKIEDIVCKIEGQDMVSKTEVQDMIRKTEVEEENLAGEIEAQNTDHKTE